jgi:hypothetical protein
VVVDLAARREENDVKGLNAFGYRQFRDEVAERGDPAVIDAAVQVVLPEHGHHLGFVARGPVVSEEELLHHGLAPNRRGDAIVPLAVEPLDFHFQRPEYLLH